MAGLKAGECGAYKSAIRTVCLSSYSLFSIGGQWFAIVMDNCRGNYLDLMHNLCGKIEVRNSL